MLNVSIIFEIFEFLKHFKRLDFLFFFSYNSDKVIENHLIDQEN